MKRMMKGMAAMAFLLAMAGCNTVGGIIVTPIDGQTVSGSEIDIAVQPTVTLVSEVRFYLDGVEMNGSPVSLPSGDGTYKLRWDTTTEYEGAHTLKVEVYVDGSLAESESITVYVAIN